jgi:DNA-binding NarL/FixJ family response regulator
MPRKVIRVLLADDHEVLRDGLVALIERQADMQIVATVGSGRSAVQLAGQLRPDVVVMDIAMPDLNGIDATRRLTSGPNPIKVLCLSMHKEQSLIGSMLRAGAAGYLVKNCAGRELVDAIRTVASGQTYLSPMIAGDVVQEFVCSRPDPSRSVYARLSEREREVLQLIAEGHNTKEIADRLHISEKTVAAHRLNVMKTLNIHTIAELTRYAIRQGIVEP